MADNAKKWQKIRVEYSRYIKSEKRLSENTVEAYLRDIDEFMHFVLRTFDVAYDQVEGFMIERFMARLFDKGRSGASQARSLSGIKSFYNFLLLSYKIEQLPTESVDPPKAERVLPDVLSLAEIDAMLATFDMSSVKGCRDSAIVEVLYSIGKLPRDVAAAIRRDCAENGLDASKMAVFCDPARPDSIAELRTQYGINAYPGINRDKPGRIGYLQGFRVKYIGEHIRDEVQTYSWKPSQEDEDVFTDIPQDGGDHAMDAASYGTTYLRRMGIANDDGDLPGGNG